MTRFLQIFLTVAIIALPAAASAATVTIGALFPGTTAGVGTPVTFNVILQGFTSPTYKLVDSFPAGALSVNINSSGSFSWTPNKDHIGSHTITVTATDDYGNTGSDSVAIAVIAPTASVNTPTPGSTVRFGTTVNFAITAAGFLTPTYATADNHRNSTVTLYNTRDDGTFIWTPTFQDIGVHNLLVTVKDYRNTATTSQTITVVGLPTMNIVNLSPGSSVAAESTLSLEATTTGLISPKFFIQDSFYNGTTSPLSIDSSGRVSWNPTARDVGTHFVTISATDTSPSSATAQATITVVPAGTSVPTSAVAPASAPGTAVATTMPKYVFTKDLSVGSRGAEVVALQQRLTALGFFKAEATGYFGAVTKLAVQAYQKSVQLPTVGRVGPATRASLNK